MFGLSKYIGTNEIMGHTYIAVNCHSRAERDKKHIFTDSQLTQIENKNKWMHIVGLVHTPSRLSKLHYISVNLMTMLIIILGVDPELDDGDGDISCRRFIASNKDSNG